MSHDHPHDDKPAPSGPAAPDPASFSAGPGAPISGGPGSGPAVPGDDSRAQALANALRSSFVIVRLLMAGLVVAFVVSGMFTVAPNQVAVRLTFGKPVGTTEKDQLLLPGLHWKLPYPIDEIVTVPVGETRTLTSTAGWYAMTPAEELAGGKSAANAAPSLQPGLDGYTLTGDGNIVHVRATLNYRITDPIRYAFEFANITNVLQHVLDNALYSTSARFNADEALYSRRAAFSESVVAQVNAAIERYRLGIGIDPREVRIDPPLYVQGAFDDVLKSQQEHDRRVLEAETYARTATNSALAEASVVVQNSLTLSNTLVRAVATDATNFLGLLPAWDRNPGLLRDRLLAETSQRVLTNAQFKAFLPTRSDGRPRELRLQLNREPERPTKVEAPANK